MARTKRLILLSIFIITAASSAVYAQGEAGAGSLIIPPGARANGMGQSFGAIANDATAMWWNPAGMAFVDHTALDLMHSQLVPDLASDVFFEYIGGIYRIKGIGTIGFAIQYLTYGEWTVTGTTPDELGTASSWEVAPMIGGAVKLGDQLSLGMNLKFVYISLAPAWATLEGTEGTGSSVAIDFGALWKVPDFGLSSMMIRRLSLGLNVSNIGPSITFMNRDQAASLPRNLRGSFAWAPIWSEVSKWFLTAEINRPMVEFERSNTYHVGTEFLYANLIALRLGYVYDKDGNVEAATYGLGFAFNNRVRIDWASVPQAQDLARVHRWSLGVNF
jgi:hypothetical protein